MFFGYKVCLDKSKMGSKYQKCKKFGPYTNSIYGQLYIIGYKISYKISFIKKAALNSDGFS